MSSPKKKRKRLPGKRCVVMFCNNTNDNNVSLHQFPNDAVIARKWITFVNVKREDEGWVPGTGHICSDHFRPDDYENYGAYLRGYTSKLILKKGSVPSVQPIPTDEQLTKARQLSKKLHKASSTTTNVNKKKRKSRALSKLTCNRVRSFLELN